MEELVSSTSMRTEAWCQRHRFEPKAVVGFNTSAMEELVAASSCEPKARVRNVNSNRTVEKFWALILFSAITSLFIQLTVNIFFSGINLLEELGSRLTVIPKFRGSPGTKTSTRTHPRLWSATSMRIGEPRVRILRTLGSDRILTSQLACIYS